MVIGQTLNQLTKENPDNHNRYLNRMQNSAQISTKALIPMYTVSGQILDVGCGNGFLMEAIIKEHPTSTVTGLELNSTSAQICREKGFTVYERDICAFAKHPERRYDCIVFSSVLHEISTYAVDDKEKFTPFPIKKALRAAYKLLNPGGRVIIRDGLAFASEDNMQLICKRKETKDAFIRFIHETPIEKYHEGDAIDNIIKAPGNCLKEFLFTYTWGEESWHREILEQYGILTCKEWISVIQEAGFIISQYSTSPEQYKDYLIKDFEDTPDFEKLLSENTILICAVK